MRPSSTAPHLPKRGKRSELIILGVLAGIVVLGIVLTLNSGTLATWR